jgi:hypothetical protein
MDFDGLCSAVLLKELGVISSIHYCHPRDITEGRIAVTKDDVLSNVPYAEGCGLWFDHHSSEQERHDLGARDIPGSSMLLKSAAHVIYEYYDDDRLDRFGDLVDYCDKVDSADLTEEDILNPEGWVLLGFICDPRTGLGYRKDFRISYYDLMLKLVDDLRTKGVDEVLADPDVAERVEFYRTGNEEFKVFLKAHSRMDGPVVVIDTRGVSPVPTGNRFMVYSLFPEANVSVRLISGKVDNRTVIAVGYSILNKTAHADVGSIMLRYGGGGHRRVGTCDVPEDRLDEALADIIAELKRED